MTPLDQSNANQRRVDCLELVLKNHDKFKCGTKDRCPIESAKVLEAYLYGPDVSEADNVVAFQKRK